jgi:hypothetical protein
VYVLEIIGFLKIGFRVFKNWQKFGSNFSFSILFLFFKEAVKIFFGGAKFF